MLIKLKMVDGLYEVYGRMEQKLLSKQKARLQERQPYGKTKVMMLDNTEHLYSAK